MNEQTSMENAKKLTSFDYDLLCQVNIRMLLIGKGIRFVELLVKLYVNNLKQYRNKED